MLFSYYVYDTGYNGVFGIFVMHAVLGSFSHGVLMLLMYAFFSSAEEEGR